MFINIKVLSIVLAAGMLAIGWPVQAQTAGEEVAAKAVAADTLVTEEAVKATARDVGLSDSVIGKLDGELLYDLVRHKIREDRLAGEIRPETWAVPIAVFLFTFLCVVFILAYRSKNDRQKHETMRLMVEKGAEIPDRLLDPPSKKLSDLRKGVLLLSAGIGFTLFMLMLALFTEDAINGAPVGIVPAFIGIGYLIVHRLDKKTA